jgi:hypothetical protein
MSRSARLKAALRKLKNPYASLQVEVAGADLSPNALIDASSSKASVAPVTLTQSDFEQRARAIFRPYIPAEEHGRLRPHYREFIERNKSLSPQTRFNVITQLRRYDLSDLSGLSPKFNREEEAFTKEKLLEIEARAGAKADDQKP